MLRTFEEARAAYANERVLSLDLETSGFSPWNDKIAVIALYGPVSGEIAVLHYPRGVHVPQEVVDWLATFEEIVTHNGTQFDILFLANAGMPWKKVEWYDTLIGEQSVISVGRRDVRVNLQDTIKRRLGKKIDKSIDHGSWGNLELDENQLAYVTGDISHLYDLQQAQLKKAKADTTGAMLRGLHFETTLIPNVVKMILRGLPVDVAMLNEYVESSVFDRDAIAPRLHAVLGDDIKLSSPVALTKRLEELWPGMFKDTKAETLQEYARLTGPIAEFSKDMLAWRHSDQRRKMFSPKFMDQYVVWHADGPRLHGKFWQIGTETGRFSSSNPNLQQMPRDARFVFRHPTCVIGKSDYAAIEVRVAAALAKDAAMIEAFNAGEDIHRLVASAGFSKPPEEITSEERRIAKAMSFTFLFGGGLETFLAYCSTNGSTIDRETGRRAMAGFFERFTGIKRMRERAEFRCATGQALPIVYPTGLKRMLVGDDLRASVLLNNVVQGTAAAGLKMALRLMGEDGVIDYVCAVVHDEVVYWAPEDEIEDVRQRVDRCMLLGMHEALMDCDPIRIGVESTWGPSWKGLEEHEQVTERDRAA